MTKHRGVLIEIVVFTVGIVYLIYALRSLLLFGTSTISHDNMLWGYPGFQFFADSIIHGNFPLWNPFSHGGEPFYPILFQLRLLDPITYGVAYLGHFFTDDLLILFNWDRVIRGLLAAFGAYIVFRPLAKHLFIRLSLIPILLYSSSMLIVARSNGIFDNFIWVPYITFFLLRIVYYRDYRWRNWLALGAFTGINWQSYMFTGTWIFLLFMGLGLAIFRRDLLLALFKSRRVIPKLVVLAVIILGMALPYISLLPAQGDYVYPPRMIDYDFRSRLPLGGPVQYESGPEGLISGGIRMPYDYLSHTGSFSSIWDFIQVISPEANPAVRGPAANPWGNPSEAFMYLGLLAWAMVLLGLVAGRHDLKRVWLVILVGLGLLMLGPAGGLHRLLYFVYPPLWFVRHTHTFVLLFLFAALYFYVLGCNRLVSSWRQPFEDQGAEGGPLSHLVKNASLRLGLASVMFSATYVLSVNWMAGLGYPDTNYLFLIFFPIFNMGLLLRKDLGVFGFFVSLLISSIILVLILSPTPFKEGFLLHTLLFLGIPLVLLLLPPTLKTLPRGVLVYLPLVFLAFLTADLVQNFTASSFLYDRQTPAQALNIKTTPQEARFPETRLPYPPTPSMGPYGQPMRYVELIYRQPYVFSPVNPSLFREGSRGSLKANDLLQNSSFETWASSPQGLILPQWVYRQGGTGGLAERYIAQDGIKDGSASVRINPSSSGHSFIRFESSQVEELRGRQGRFSVWVKSRNQVPHAVQVDIQDGVGPVAVQSYQNSGDWEQIVVRRIIDPGAKKLFLTLNVQSYASDGAFFDGAALKFEEAKVGTTAYALNHRRWSSFFLSRSYFNLVNSNLPPPVLEEMFAVNRPLLQFKGGFLPLDRGKALDYLGELEPEQAVQLLQEKVILEGPLRPELASPRGSPQEGFTYSVEKYDYDSLKVRVSSPADGLLYWADGYNKDWRAFVDGREVPLYRANVNFKAIELPAGAHEVTFIYDPSTFKLGLLIFYGLLLVSLAGVVVDSRAGIRRWQVSIRGWSASVRTWPGAAKTWQGNLQARLSQMTRALVRLIAPERTRRIAIYVLAAAFIASITIWTFHKIDLPSGLPPSLAPRWGIMSFSDFLTLMAGKRFNEEGFARHYLLNNMTVGYPEFSRGWYYYQVPQTVANSAIYYTHYGSLDGIINGLLQRFGVSDLLALYKFAAILVAISLAFWFGAASILFGRFVALVSVLFIGSSLLFLRLMDTIAGYSYDFFFAFGAVFLFLVGHRLRYTRPVFAKLALIATWVFIFLQASNTPEFVLWIPITLLGFLWIWHGSLLRQWRQGLFLLSAPISAYLLHFIRVAWVLGGLGNFVRDLMAGLMRRTLGFELAEELPFREFPLTKVPGYINQLLEHYFGMGVLATVILLIALFVIIRALRQHIEEQKGAELGKTWRMLLVLLVAGVAFWIPYVEGTVTGVVVRTYLAFAGVLVGLCLLYSFRYLRLQQERLLRRVLVVVLVLLALLPAFWPRISGDVFALRLHFRPTEDYGRLPDELTVLADFLKEETAYGDIILTNINTGETGHPRYPFPAYEYLSERRIEITRDMDSLRKRIADFRAIRDALPYSNPAKGVRFYLLLEEGYGSQDFVDFAADLDSSAMVLDTVPWSLERFGFIPGGVGVAGNKRFLVYRFEPELTPTPKPTPELVPLAEFTNGSFESWVLSPEGVSLLEQWLYYQDGAGGSVTKYVAANGVRDGSASALVQPSSIGNSFIRYEIPQGAKFRGGYVQFSVWVKSQNKTSNAIQVDIQDGVGPVVVQSYRNSGDWERIVVWKYIDPRAKRVLITLNVKAPASAFFDGAIMLSTHPIS